MTNGAAYITNYPKEGYVVLPPINRIRVRRNRDMGDEYFTQKAPIPDTLRQ